MRKSSLPGNHHGGHTAHRAFYWGLSYMHGPRKRNLVPPNPRVGEGGTHTTSIGHPSLRLQKDEGEGPPIDGDSLPPTQLPVPSLSLHSHRVGSGVRVRVLPRGEQLGRLCRGGFIRTDILATPDLRGQVAKTKLSFSSRQEEERVEENRNRIDPQKQPVFPLCTVP